MPDFPSSFFRARSHQLFLCSIFFLLTIRGAVGPIPYISILPTVSKAWPESALPASQDYLLNSPVGLLVFKSLRSNSPVAYLLMCLFFIGLGFFLLYRYFMKTSPAPLAGSLVRIFMLSELGYVLLRWTGSYDAFTFVFWMLLLIGLKNKQWVIVFLSSTMLGFNHFEQTIVGVIGIFLAYQFLGSLKEKAPTMGIVLFGTISGKLALLGFLTPSELAGRNSWLTIENFRAGAIEIISNFGYFLWSVFSVVWIIVYIIFKHNSWKKLSTPFAFFILAFIVSTLTRDHTRVFVLTTLPCLLLLIDSKVKTGELKELDIYKVELVSWIIPPLILWEGTWIFPYNYIEHLLKLS